MRILEIKAQNFLTFQNFEIDFRPLSKGVTVIVGDNGAGKSSIFEAITWGLFGQTIRNIPVKKVRNRHSDKGDCMVRLVLEVHNEEFIIERRRTKGGALTIFGTGLSAKGTPAALQEEVESMLDIDYTYFLSAALFGGNVSSFCSLTDAQRRAILRRLLGFEAFQEAYDKAKIEAMEARRELEGLNHSVDRLNRDLTMLKEQAADTTEEVKAHEFRRQANILRIQFEFDDIFDEYWEIAEKYAASVQDAKRKAKQYASAVSEFETNEKKVDEKLHRFILEKGELTGKLETTLEEIARHKKELKKLSQINRNRDPKTCPTCSRPSNCPNCGFLLSSDLPEEITTTPVKEHIDDAAARRLECINKLEVVDEEIRKLSKEKQSIRRPDKPNYELLGNLEYKMDSFKGKIKSTQDRYLASYNETSNPYEKALRNLKSRIDQIRADKKKIKSKQGVLGHSLQIASYWEKAYHYKGIPALLLDNAVPQLSAHANRYAIDLTDGDLTIKFESYDDESEKLKITPVYNRGADLYEGASYSEKFRIDLCILLAIRDVIENAYGMRAFSQIFLDEIFDGLDEHNTEAILAMFRRQFKDKSVFLISHDDSLKSFADNVILVTKDDNKSSITVS